VSGQPPDPSGKPLHELRDRIARIRERDERAEASRRGKADMRGGGIVLRVGIELAGTLAVGVAIGWGLDKWLGTGPWLLVVFFFLGAAGGVLNVYRAVGNMGLAAGYQKPDGADDGPGSKE
jgi:ATP synthase protein I